MVKIVELTKVERGKILGLRASSKSIREISKTLKIPKSTVQYTIAHYSNSDNMKSAPRSGRPKSLNNKENQKTLQKIVDKNNRSSLDQIQRKFIKKSGVEVSTRTI
nr:12755_t:CDS:1 [Entrophospora candida]